MTVQRRANGQRFCHEYCLWKTTTIKWLRKRWVNTSLPKDMGGESVLQPTQTQEAMICSVKTSFNNHSRLTQEASWPHEVNKISQVSKTVSDSLPFPGPPEGPSENRTTDLEIKMWIKGKYCRLWNTPHLSSGCCWHFNDCYCYYLSSPIHLKISVTVATSLLRRPSNLLQIGLSDMISPHQPLVNPDKRPAFFLHYPRSPWRWSIRIYEAPRRAPFPGDRTRGQSHKKFLCTAWTSLCQTHLTLMIVFVILHSKVQSIFSDISEQGAPLSCLGLFQITTLEFFSNHLQWDELESRKRKKWMTHGVFKPHRAAFLQFLARSHR